MLPIRSGICGLLLQCGWLTSLKKTNFFFLSYQLPMTPQLEVKLHGCLPSLVWSELLGVLCLLSHCCEFVWATSPLCLVRTELPYTHTLPLAPRLFPSPLLQWSLGPGSEGCNMDVLPRAQNATVSFFVLFSTSCRSLCWSPPAKGSFSGEGWEMHWEPGSRRVKGSKGESTTITLLLLLLTRY